MGRPKLAPRAVSHAELVNCKYYPKEVLLSAQSFDLLGLSLIRIVIGEKQTTFNL